MAAGDPTRGFEPPLTPVELQRLMAVGLDTKLYDVATACLMAIKSTDASLPELCKQAMATRRKVSIPACRVFGPHGCMEVFLSLLAHPESLVREQAVDVLRYVGGDEVLLALKRARQDPSEMVQMFANRAVRALEGPVGPVTFDKGGPIRLQKVPLREPTPRDRTIALVIIGRDLGASDDPAFAASLLMQHDGALREATLRALETNASYRQAFYDHRARRRRPPGEIPVPLVGLLPGDRARDALLAAARDGDRRVRAESLAALTGYNLEGARDDLVELLRDAAAPVDGALAELLERAFADDGEAFLRLYLEDEAVRRRGGAVLGAVAGAAALLALTAALDSPFREVRESAMRGLGRVPHVESFRLLLRFLEPPYGSRTAVASEACAELFSRGVESPAEVVDSLTTVVTRTSGSTRQLAGDALAFAVQLDGGIRVRAILAFVGLLERLPEIPPGALDILAFGRGTEAAIAAASSTAAAPNEGLRRLEETLFARRKAVKLKIERNFGVLRQPGAPLLEAEPGRLGSSSHLSTTAPRTVAPGSKFVLSVWVHAFEPDEMLRRARAMASGRPISIQTKHGAAMQSGQTFEVSIELPGFALDETRDTLFWEGRRDSIASCTFAVSVPADARFGTHLGKAVVWLHGLRVAKLDFATEVGAEEARIEDVTLDEARAQTAFASYANEDLPLVLARIQGMQRILPDLDVFLDVVSLRAGEDWQRRLAKEIVERDLFLLFWSIAASKSSWVDREWRTAFQAGGLAAISPVPLQPAAAAPPPPELASLNFNDWTLALGQAWERGRTPEH